MGTEAWYRGSVSPLLFAVALVLAGCWTAPVANVQPKGEARLIEGGITVESVKDPAIVQSVDAGTRTLVVTYPPDSAKSSYKVSPNVSDFDKIKAGSKVEATVKEELTVYVLKDGQLPGPGGAPQTIKADARVLMVDPAYRLLTLQYPNGRRETVKVALGVKLEQMEAGNSVVIRSIEAVALGVETP